MYSRTQRRPRRWIAAEALHAFAPSAKNLKVGSRDVKLVEAWSFVSYVGTNFIHHKVIKIATTVEVATSDSSFSAVSTATVASKDAFFSIFRNLHNAHSFAF